MEKEEQEEQPAFSVYWGMTWRTLLEFPHSETGEVEINRDRQKQGRKAGSAGINHIARVTKDSNNLFCK